MQILAWVDVVNCPQLVLLSKWYFHFILRLVQIRIPGRPIVALYHEFFVESHSDSQFDSVTDSQSESGSAISISTTPTSEY